MKQYKRITKAWVTVDKEDNSIRDISINKEKPMPIHSWLEVVRATVTYVPLKRK